MSKSHTHEDPKLTGLDAMSAKMPVVERDARETITTPIAIGKPPADWIEEVGSNIEPGDAYLAFTGSEDNNRIPGSDIERNQLDVLDQFRENHPDAISAIDTDDIEIGEAIHIADVELTFKRIDGWCLTRYEFEVFDDPIEESFIDQ